jgi:hypothetical protein
MQSNLVRKGFTYIIILLIIQILALSNISGKICEIDSHQPRDPKDNSPFNNNYILAFWKYNEGSGTIAYDSSGNNFDGTINGASWINGHSGNALDFDGTDDFIALDDYSNNLGINKTDDVIFSVWFKTKSTEDSLIYSISDKFGISNPELSIQTCANGSIMFKIWTRYCGITVYSEDSYNDDDWHHLEIFFNGISAKPTTKIYVDKTLDGNDTTYLCPIENNEFHKVKTGRRAVDSTKHFDGLIDEFKIIKYPDGNQQISPIISGPTDGQPGIEYDYTFITKDPEEDNIWLYIDWGDGEEEKWIGPYNSSKEVVVSHTWSKVGRYEIKAKSKDIWDDGPWSDPYPVNIGNQPPDQPDIDGPKSGEIEVEYEFSFEAHDYEEDNIYYYIDWGDGTIEDWFGPFGSGETVYKNHKWKTKNVFEIRAKAKDKHNNEGELSEPYLISIGNQAPDAPDISGPEQGTPGIEYKFNFSINDPDSDFLYLRIDWGSGTPGVWQGPFSSGTKIKFNHTWNQEGSYTIRAQAMDIFDMESKWGTLKISIPKNQQFSNYVSFRYFTQLFALFQEFLSSF